MIVFDKEKSSSMHAGVTLVYELAAVVGFVTADAAQGIDGVWRQETRVGYQGIYARVWLAC